MRRFLKSERGSIDGYIVLIIVMTVLMISLVLSAELVIVPRTQNTLQTAAEMLAKSESINGCITSDTEAAVSNFLLQNQLDPTKIYFKIQPNTIQNYGNSVGTAASPNLTLGYDLNVFKLSSTHIWNKYVEVQVPVSISAYVNTSVSDSSGCVGTVSFTGTQGGQNSGGAASMAIQGSVANSISASVPTVTTQGTITNISGQTDLPFAQVSIFGAGYTASTIADSSGNFSFPADFSVAGNGQVITIESGTASQVYTINVNSVIVGSIDFTSPSPASVKIGQAFNIAGIPYDVNGVVVPDGTKLDLSSTDSTDIPNQTVSVLNGQFVVSVSGVTQNLSSVVVTVSGQSYTISISPSDPKTITLTVAQSSQTAGSSVTFSGFVAGYDDIPVQDNTQIQLTDNGNSLGTVYTTGGNYSLTSPLTYAGNNSIVATVVGYSMVNASQNITVLPSVPYTVVGLSGTPNPVNVGSNTGITGLVEDQYGNLVTGQSYSLQTNLSSPNPTSTFTNSSTGQISFNASFNSPGFTNVFILYSGQRIGSVNVQVVSNTSSNGLTLKPVQSTYTAIAGQSVSNIAFVLTNSNGNPVQGDIVNFSGVPGVTTSSTTDVNGEVFFNSSVLTIAQSYTLTATMPNVPNLISVVGIIVTPGSPYQIVGANITPSPAQVGSTAYVSGMVEDFYGNPDTSGTVTASATSISPAASSSLQINGGFMIPVTVQNSGTGVITLTDGSATTTVTLTGQPKAVTLKLSLTGGSAIVNTGQLTGLQASILDSSGNPISGILVSFASSAGSNVTWSPQWGATDSSGNVQETAVFGSSASGNQTVTATAVVNGQTVSSVLSVYVTQSSLSNIVWGTITPTTDQAGNPVSISGQALDMSGTPLANQQIQIFFKEVGTNTQILTTDSNGYFSTNLTPITTGTRTIIGEIGTSLVQCPTQITVVPGPPVGGTISFSYTSPLLTNDSATATITLKDIAGNPVPAHSLTVNITSATNSFTNPNTWHSDTCTGGGTIQYYAGSEYCSPSGSIIPGYYTYQYPETLTTDSNGQVSIPFNTNLNSGTITVTASTGSVNFSNSISVTQATPTTGSIGGIYMTSMDNATIYFNVYDQKGRIITAAGTMSGVGYAAPLGLESSQVNLTANNLTLYQYYWNYGYRSANTPQQINSGTVYIDSGENGVQTNYTYTDSADITYVVSGITFHVQLNWKEAYGQTVYTYTIISQ